MYLQSLPNINLSISFIQINDKPIQAYSSHSSQTRNSLVQVTGLKLRQFLLFSAMSTLLPIMLRVYMDLLLGCGRKGPEIGAILALAALSGGTVQGALLYSGHLEKQPSSQKKILSYTIKTVKFLLKIFYRKTPCSTEGYCIPPDPWKKGKQISSFPKFKFFAWLWVLKYKNKTCKNQ